MNWFLSLPSSILLFFLVSAEFSPVQSHVDSEVAVSAAQSALQPEFTPPPPGSYTLPPIDTIGNHPLLDSAGETVDLFTLTAGKIAVVSFMYTACADVGGCPLAAAVLQQVDQMLERRPALAKHVVLLSITFDIERDHPARLAEIRNGLAPRGAWYFLTSANQDDLQSVLADFNQPVAKLWQEDGSWSGLFRHVLKVYLLDARHQVRNIYSTGLFNAQLVINDIETVLMEATQQHTTSGQP
jgi:cytochrome oxidase Cu insertion factor (SCO1/SenC/PrrC family)